VKVTFTFSVEGEDCADPLIGYIDLDSKTQTITVTGKLPSPPSKPPAGTKVVYVVTATHPQAEQPAKSDSVEILVTYPGDDADDGEHIEDRTVVITTEDGGLLAGAQYVLCEDGKAFKKGKLNPDSLLAYKAKPGCKYSVYMVNADEANESEQEENSQDV
jgi:hypothetical protein